MTINIARNKRLTQLLKTTIQHLNSNGIQTEQASNPTSIHFILIKNGKDGNIIINIPSKFCKTLNIHSCMFVVKTKDNKTVIECDYPSLVGVVKGLL